MTTTAPVAIAWFRRDLRLTDNPALAAAVAAGGAVVPVFVLDPALLRTGAGANRTWFLLESVRELARGLAAAGAPLVVRHGDPADVIPALAREAGAAHVHAARDVSPFARQRDAAVGGALERDGRSLHLHRGQLIAEPEAVVTADGRPYTVFTPYHRRWQEAPLRTVLAAPARLIGTAASLRSDELPAIEPTGERLLLPRPGEDAARGRLAAWAAGDRPGAYADARNLLAIDGTSRLSADLKAGTLSPLGVLAATNAAGAEPPPPVRFAPAGRDGRAVFASELAWRDFYAQVLWHHPHVARGAFRPAFDRLPWRDAPAELDAWRAGRTGYPVVDAAMRQLRESGWMHNRARMIAASFLTKDLLLDWRLGERHFMDHLVDGDPAANNGGWQWTAGTGTDAAPFFRIFNPVTQGERFDPDGAYVRRWVPELAGLPAAAIHAPWRLSGADQRRHGVVIGRDYPAPIVDHAAARERALAAFATIGTTERP